MLLAARTEPTAYFSSPGFATRWNSKKHADRQPKGSTSARAVSACIIVRSSVTCVGKGLSASIAAARPSPRCDCSA
eukprot:5596737-Lingulodinium_polyedra.AAC.1